MGPAGSGARATITRSLLGDAPFSLRDGAIFFAPQSERLSKCNKLSFLAACSIWVIPSRGQMA
ncbi:protein of unknown function [Cupriavidus taiwanensis]|uniref:Uncharacterized protein n=1 Tax=Cupriavidus taiwanensis TaxID=164546 RepID=A0A7Z7NMM2_9BURK|nr:protein of unknown function [Cupriavidus taiwanensis]SOZ05611.1 hypothetical protein CBM2595_A80296 [Cupriavidus taiwanensis]SOZ07595.1 hypothetical protein CBM2597_A90201 [Cupriavidus taiwanensis]SPC15633.1 hypothetical protein CBM2594_A70198 [Cupriavidus taiwanensis]SPD40285.1 protein of unknown function [Cupriavidus taiwanensis]